MTLYSLQWTCPGRVRCESEGMRVRTDRHTTRCPATQQVTQPSDVFRACVRAREPHMPELALAPAAALRPTCSPVRAVSLPIDAPRHARQLELSYATASIVVVALSLSIGADQRSLLYRFAVTTVCR